MGKPSAAAGTVLVGATFVKVEWMWLLLPLTVWILALVVWLGAIWKSRASGAPLWRDDVLPLIFASQDIKNVAMQEECGTVSTRYTTMAEELRVKLVNSGSQFHLIEQ